MGKILPKTLGRQLVESATGAIDTIAVGGWGCLFAGGFRNAADIQSPLIESAMIVTIDCRAAAASGERVPINFEDCGH